MEDQQTDQQNQNNNQSNDPIHEELPIIFNNYKAIKLIGKGKFALVYRAHPISDPTQTLALKRISIDQINPKAREKCLKEVRLLQSLNHPNIIQYMDSFILNNDLIIIYEWAAAGDLKRQLRKALERNENFSERIVWKYFSQIALAMNHMHEKRILHRDLKPANIFLTLDGMIKVGDLGLSRELSEDTIQAHSKVGTPLYMSPEVLKGDGYDFKSDIWSLGCLLYELCALKSPFKSEGLNLYSLFQKISNGEYQKLPEFYSIELRELCYKMISIDPKDRPEIGYVVEVANKMRQQTLEKSKKKSEENNDDNNEPISRTPSGNIERPGSNNFSRPNSNQYERDRDRERDRERERDRDREREREREREMEKERERERELEKISYNYKYNEEKHEEGLGIGLDEYFNSKKSNEKDPNPYRSSSNGLNSRENERDKEKERERERQRQRENEKFKFSDRDRDRENNKYNNNNNSENTSSSKLNRPNSAYKRAKPQVPQPSQVPSSSTHSSSTSSRIPINNNYNNNVDSKQIVEALTDSSPSFSLMDNVYTKLILLNCPLLDYIDISSYKSSLTNKEKSINSRDKLLPFHFAINLSVFPSIAGFNSNSSNLNIENNTQNVWQFRRFVSIFVWIIEEFKENELILLVSSIEIDKTSPIIICKQLLTCLNRALKIIKDESNDNNNHENYYNESIDPSLLDIIKELNPNSIINGYGYNICLILDILLNLLLKKNKFIIKNTKLINNNEDNLDDEKEDEDEDEIDEILSDDDANIQNKDEINQSFSTTSFINHQPIISSANPNDWLLEVETVGPKLKALEKENLSKNLNFDNYENHIKIISNYSQQYQLTSTITASDISPSSTLSLPKEIKSYQDLLINELTKLKSSENYLNNNPSYLSFITSYKELINSFNNYVEKNSQNNELINQYTNNLNEINEKIEELLEEINNKDDNKDNTSSVVNIKNSIKTLTDNIDDLNKKIIIMSNEIINLKKDDNILKLKKMKNKNKNNKNYDHDEYDD